MVGSIRARVDDQFWVDFVAKGVWALTFSTMEQYVECVKYYEDSK